MRALNNNIFSCTCPHEDHDSSSCHECHAPRTYVDVVPHPQEQKKRLTIYSAVRARNFGQLSNTAERKLISPSLTEKVCAVLVTEPTNDFAGWTPAPRP